MSPEAWEVPIQYNSFLFSAFVAMAYGFGVFENDDQRAIVGQDLVKKFK
jgi:hypothetical protein